MPMPLSTLPHSLTYFPSRVSSSTAAFTAASRFLPEEAELEFGEDFEDGNGVTV